MFQKVVDHVATIHVRFDGRSFDVSASVLDVGARSSDRDVLRALAGHLGVSDERLDGYVVDRHRNGNLTVRPQAVFG